MSSLPRIICSPNKSTIINQNRLIPNLIDEQLDTEESTWKRHSMSQHSMMKLRTKLVWPPKSGVWTLQCNCNTNCKVSSWGELTILAILKTSLIKYSIPLRSIDAVSFLGKHGHVKYLVLPYHIVSVRVYHISHFLATFQNYYYFELLWR